MYVYDKEFKHSLKLTKAGNFKTPIALTVQIIRYSVIRQHITKPQY